MAKKRRRTNYEFKPDIQKVPLLKKLHLTRLQQRQLLQWTLYGLVCLVLLAVQDVLMSQLSIRGATTDLVVCAILLVTVLSDSHEGSLWALIASMLYVFSGSSPGPYVIAFISILGIGAVLLRQLYWHRGFTSTVLCAGMALLVYELAVYATGLFLGLTYWSRIGVFLLTWALSFAVMVALYPLMRAIQKIGGETWKE